MTNTHVQMVQMSKFRWNLVSPTGSVMVESVLLASKQAAEDWARAYLSSFPSWGLILIPLSKGSV